MSCLQDVDVEISAATVAERHPLEMTRRAVSTGRERLGARVARMVEKIVDSELAQGSMPA